MKLKLLILTLTCGISCGVFAAENGKGSVEPVSKPSVSQTIVDQETAAKLARAQAEGNAVITAPVPKRVLSPRLEVRSKSTMCADLQSPALNALLHFQKTAQHEEEDVKLTQAAQDLRKVLQKKRISIISENPTDPNNILGLIESTLDERCAPELVAKQDAAMMVNFDPILADRMIVALFDAVSCNEVGHVRNLLHSSEFLRNQTCAQLANDHEALGERALDTPYCIAARWGFDEVLAELIKYNSQERKPGFVADTLIGSIDVENADGDTPLILAAINGHAEVVRMLLNAGADKEHMNKAGKTAMAVATKQQIISLLNGKKEGQQSPRDQKDAIKD